MNGSFCNLYALAVGWRYISSLHSADEPREGRNSCPLLRSYFIGSCHVGVSKRFPRSISLAVYCLSSKLEPAIWSSDAGQRIPCFNRCQLIIAWMSNIKEDPKKYMHGKPRLHVLVNLLLEYGRHLARLRRRRHRAYAPTNNTASHDNDEKNNSWVSFSFLIEVWGSAWRPGGLVELR